MSSYLVAVIFGAGAFFMCCTIFLILADSMKFHKSMSAIKKLALAVKGNQDNRKREIEDFLVKAVGYTSESEEVKKTTDEIFDKEIAFYKSTMKILQDKSYSSIENYSVYVESLLAPYYKLTIQAAPVITQSQVETSTETIGQQQSAAIASNGQDQPITNIEGVAPAGTETEQVADASAMDPQALAEMKANYENELAEAQTKVDELESSKKKINNVLEKVFKTYMGLFGKDAFNPEDLEVEAIVRTIDEMIANDAKPIASGDGDISADGALLEQLKFEKVELMNKYDSAMKTLNQVYKEYAAAFGMDKGGSNELTLEQIRSLMGDEDADAGDGSEGESADDMADIPLENDTDSESNSQAQG